MYDNMADPWPFGAAKRAEKHPEAEIKVPDEIIVVNASAGLAWSSGHRLRIPFFALLRDVDVMYDNSAGLRVRQLIRHLNRDDKSRGEFDSAPATSPPRSRHM